MIIDHDLVSFSGKQGKRVIRTDMGFGWYASDVRTYWLRISFVSCKFRGTNLG